MANIGVERRRRWAQAQLERYPFLTAPQRRFLSVPLMASGWHLVVDGSGGSPGRAAAFAIGRTGVYALVFTDEVPDRGRLRRVRVHAEELFAAALADGSRLVPHTLEVVLLMPRAVPVQVHDPFLAADEAGFGALLFDGDRTVSRPRVRELALSVAARSERYELIAEDDAPRPEPDGTGELFGIGDLRDDERRRALGRPFP
ncbi:hypothetical protein [Nocardia sp. NPDC057353]|uniref:hypothetical protein n=1 Tax=Nocardia sp. NPDC057353 TaxID=3346104 RepID=UPI003637B7C5